MEYRIYNLLHHPGVDEITEQWRAPFEDEDDRYGEYTCTPYDTAGLEQDPAAALQQFHIAPDLLERGRSAAAFILRGHTSENESVTVYVNPFASKHSKGVLIFDESN
jgi:hypothetical protein